MRPSSSSRSVRSRFGLHAREKAVVLVAAGAVLMAGCGSRVTEAEFAAADASAGIGSAQPGTAGASGVTDAGQVPGGAATDTTAADTTASGAAPAAGGAATDAAAAGATVPTATGTATKPGKGAVAAVDSAATGGGAKAPVAAGCAKQGPPVTIGQVGSFSGLAGSNFAGAVKTPYVWVNYMNARGGLGCHPIRFLQIDTQSNPALTQAAIDRLVNKEGAIALMANFVPLEIAGFLSGLEKAKVAGIGGDQAAPEWVGISKYAFPVGGTARSLVAGSVKQASELGRKKIAVLACVETSPCGANFTNTIINDGFAKKFGMEVVYSGQVSLTQPDYTAQCQNAKSAGADTIAWGLDKAGLQRAAKSCATLNYFPTLPLISLQGSFDPTDANIRKSGAFLSSPVFPYMLDNTPALKEFQGAMKQYAPTAAIDSSASLVWASAQMLAKVVDKLGVGAQTRALTKEDILGGLDKIKNETLSGLIPATTFTVGSPQVENPCYFGIQFTAQGVFRATNGLTKGCI